jgi:hypothetical protein
MGDREGSRIRQRDRAHRTGKRSAVEFLMNYLKTHHSEIAQRVRATETADLSALTEPEIEVIAKKYMIAVL